MTINVGINGYGRIGRCVLWALYEMQQRYGDIRIVGINTMGDTQSSAHLTRYDSTHGRFAGDVKVEGTDLIVNGDVIHTTRHRNPTDIPWGAWETDVVYECSGHFTSQADAQLHLQAGAKKVLISAPGRHVEKTIVYGVNDDMIEATDTVLSNASCTTNCLAPIAKILHQEFTLVSGLVNTIHAVTNDQVLVDRNHKDLRRARAAMHSIIPTKTGAAAAVGLVLPELAGKLDGFALRVPTLNVSAVDLTFKAGRSTVAEEVNQVLKQAVQQRFCEVLEINEEPLVSIDFNHHPASAIIDLTQTKVLGDLVKVVAWYDNEWGFSCRMLDVTKTWCGA